MITTLEILKRLRVDINDLLTIGQKYVNRNLGDIFETVDDFAHHNIDSKILETDDYLNACDMKGNPAGYGLCYFIEASLCINILALKITHESFDNKNYYCQISEAFNPTDITRKWLMSVIDDHPETYWGSHVEKFYPVSLAVNGSEKLQGIEQYALEVEFDENLGFAGDTPYIKKRIELTKFTLEKLDEAIEKLERSNA